MRITLWLSAFLFLPLSLYGQQGFRVAALNTENLFDCCHDSLDNSDDYLFLPSSTRRWSWRRYHAKLHNLSKLIISTGADHPADLVALTEVENDSVLTHLTQRAILRRAKYRYVMTHSADHRGIDVALLYQPATFRLISSQSLRASFNPLPPVATRDILYVCGSTYTGDTLHVFVCHFSSKLGGSRATEPLRQAEALTVRRCVDSLQNADCRRKIIILGDFNETPAEAAVAQTLSAQPVTERPYLPDRLYNLASHTPDTTAPDGSPIRGTHKHNGQWQMLDHIIVSGTLLDIGTKIYTTAEDFHIHAPGFVLERDAESAGWKPMRTYVGYRYNGGFSDHLAVYADFHTAITE
jgi:endonuclease/exonuclease/phosphatase family metal-dependent hydrolase